jgi:hypothetical protein
VNVVLGIFPSLRFAPESMRIVRFVMRAPYLAVENLGSLVYTIFVEVITMLSEIQSKSYEFFKANLNEYLSDPLKVGKYAVIYNSELRGLFDSFESACVFAGSIAVKDFIIQRIIDESKTIDFLYSAVV